MTYRNKSASLIGTIEFKNGNRNTIHIGCNRNTGETIVWQQVTGCRSSRVTGKNLREFANTLNFVICEGEAKWVGERNDAALDCLKRYVDEQSGPPRIVGRYDDPTNPARIVGSLDNIRKTKS